MKCLSPRTDVRGLSASYLMPCIHFLMSGDKHSSTTADPIEKSPTWLNTTIACSRDSSLLASFETAMSLAINLPA